MVCIIRDFLRHPVFKECYKFIIKEEQFNKLNEQQFKIELPGDVWNNNSIFAKCFWGDNERATKSSGFVRNMYDNRKNDASWGECLPIDFDITFNFVPRMCEEDKCEICPLAQYSEYKDKDKYKNWQEKICHENMEGKWCPLALYSCGIKHRCNNQCTLRTTPKL